MRHIRRWRLWYWLFLLCTLLLAACTPSLPGLAARLEQRQLSSCLCYQGSLAGGAGFAGALLVRGVTATGTANHDHCLLVCTGGPGP